MRLLILATALIGLATTSPTFPLHLHSSTDPDACFEHNYATRFVCWFSNKVSMTQAKSAISKACSAITTCKPLIGPFANSRSVEGSVMAQLHVGPHCVMGKDDYLTAEKCEEWFVEFVSAQCGGDEEDFALGAAMFLCDNSTLSLNFGG